MMISPITAGKVRELTAVKGFSLFGMACLIDTDFLWIIYPFAADAFRRENVVFIANLPGLNRQVPHAFNRGTLIGQRVRSR